MAFRDVRHLVEMMRALNYPRLISLENFRQPNFPLVSEMLAWLVHRFEPNEELPTDTGSQQDRVMFVRSVTQFLATKVHIKLNAKKVYQADGHAVKEIIKVAQVLYDAMNTNQDAIKEHRDDPDEEVENALPTFDLGSKLSELKQTRALGSTITSEGANLYDLLGSEVELREKRTNVLARQMEISDVESALNDAISAINKEAKKFEDMIENVASNEANLDAKIEKKRVELERNEKRLVTLKKVRPAFMDEYEKLETELKQLYQSYVHKFRCLAFLEQQVEEAERAEQERMEERQRDVKRGLMNGHVLSKDAYSMEGSSDVLSDLDSDDEEDLSDDNDTNTKRNIKPKGISNRRMQGAVLLGKNAKEEDSDDLEDTDESDDDDDDNEVIAAPTTLEVKGDVLQKKEKNDDGDDIIDDDDDDDNLVVESLKKADENAKASDDDF